MPGNVTVIDIEAQFSDKTAAGVKSMADDIGNLKNSLENLKKKIAEVDAIVGKTTTEFDKMRAKVDQVETAGAKADKTVSNIGKTGSGIKGTASDVDNLNRKVKQTETAGKNADRSLSKVASTIKSMAQKTLSIPVKIIDYATRPLRSLFNFATSLKGILTGIVVGQAGQKLVSEPMALADQYSNALLGFQTLFKDRAKGQKMMDDLDEFARTTPFKTSNVIGQSQKMLAMGWDPKNIIQDMTTIGNAASALGKGDEGLERIVLALAQIKSKGKLSAEELNQLAEAGVNAKQYVAQGLGLGSGDAGAAALAERMSSKKNPVMGNEAVQAILAGMERDYGGMMEKVSKETVEGIKSNLEDTFEINIFRKWGQGLQEGAKKGLGAFSDMLDANQDKLSKLGDMAKNVAAQMSNKFADAAQFVSKQILDITSSEAFDKASIGGKAKMLWDGIIGDPIKDWWSNGGQEKTAELAGKIGEGIGTFFNNGIMAFLGLVNPNNSKEAVSVGTSVGSSFLEGFLKGFDGKKVADAIGDSLKNALGSASKILPGGQQADAQSYLSAFLLYKTLGKPVATVGKGLFKAGKGAVNIGGKLFGGAEATMAAEGAAGTAGLSLLNKTGIGGAIVGGAGLVAALRDFSEATNNLNKKESDVAAWTGVSRVGMVGAGAGLGATIGSIIPGLTLVGAGLGAGIGGLGALIGGSNLGKKISDYFDGTKKINDVSNALKETTREYINANEAAINIKDAMDKYSEAADKVNAMQKTGNTYTDEYKIAQENLKDTVQDLIDKYPEYFGMYDSESEAIRGSNDAIKEKLDLLNKLAQSELDSKRASQQIAANEAELIDPDIKQKMTEAKKERDQHMKATDEKKKELNEAQNLQIEFETLQAQKETMADSEWNEKYDEWTSKAREYAATYTDDENLNVMEYYGRGQNYERVKEEYEAENNAAKASDEQYQNFKAQRESNYSIQAAAIMNPANIPMAEVEAKLKEFEKLEDEISGLQKIIDENQGKNGDSTKKAYDEAQASMDAAKKKQEELRGELDQFKGPIDEVIKKIQDLNDYFDDIDPSKRIDISVYTHYYEVAENKVYGSSGFKGSAEDTQKLSDYLRGLAGKAVGTKNAPAGMAWVGEKGPELMKFKGGEVVYTAEESKRISERYASQYPGKSSDESHQIAESNAGTSNTGARSPVDVVIGDGAIQISINSGGDSKDIVSELRGHMPALANELAEIVAVQVSRVYSNMPMVVDGL